MKFVINDDLLIRQIEMEHSVFLRDFLHELTADFNYWNDDHGTISVRLEKGQTINIESEAISKVFLNTLDAHTTVRLKYYYLGGLKFNIQYDK